VVQGIPEEIKPLVYQEWLPKLMAAVLEGVMELPGEQRDAILTRMDKVCKDMAIEGAIGIKPGMSWEDYLAFIKGLPSPIGPWTIERRGKVFDLTYDSSIGEDGRPRCHCPLVQLGIIEPVPEMCAGGADIAADMIKAATGKVVTKAEVVGSPLRTNEPFCRYRVEVED
jgi:hypothetical protein